MRLALGFKLVGSWRKVLYLSIAPTPAPSTLHVPIPLFGNKTSVPVSLNPQVDDMLGYIGPKRENSRESFLEEGSPCFQA